MADPIGQLAHQCSHLMKDQSTNPQTRPDQYPKLGQLHYPFHPKWTALLDVASDNAHLSHDVQELCQQMDYLLLQQQHNKPNSDSISHLPYSITRSPNNNLSQVFIAQVAAPVAQVQNETTQPSTKTNKWSTTSITESPEHGALMDESFDSTTMKS